MTIGKQHADTTKPKVARPGGPANPSSATSKRFFGCGRCFGAREHTQRFGAHKRAALEPTGADLTPPTLFWVPQAMSSSRRPEAGGRSLQPRNVPVHNAHFKGRRTSTVPEEIAHHTSILTALSPELKRAIANTITQRNRLFKASETWMNEYLEQPSKCCLD